MDGFREMGICRRGMRNVSREEIPLVSSLFLFFRLK